MVGMGVVDIYYWGAREEGVVVITGVWATIFVKADNSKKTTNQKQAPANQPEKSKQAKKNPTKRSNTEVMPISITKTKEVQQKQKETHDIGRTNTRAKTANPSSKNCNTLFMCKKKEKTLKKISATA